MLDVPHRFYDKTISQQNNYLAFVCVALLVSVIGVAAISYFTGYIFFALCIPIIGLNYAPFIDLPIGKRKGRFKYYSPTLISEWHPDGRLVLHGGTLFDYWYSIRHDWSPAEKKRKVLEWYLEGLLNLIDHFDHKEGSEDLQVLATTYFVNSKNIERSGFELISTSVLQYFLIIANYFTISMALTFINQRVTFFSFKSIYTFQVSFKELRSQKDEIEGLYLTLLNRK